MTPRLHQYRLLPIYLALIFIGVLMLVGPVLANVDRKIVGKRVALVVGNSNYESVYDLKNAVNDSRSIAVVLARLGFEVIERSDITRSEFQSALTEFQERSQDAEAAVFYYSGHGFQLGGTNFLVPTDAKLNDRKKILEETLKLNDVIEAVQDRDRQTLIFLDACRNNPLPESVRDENMLDGLAQLDAGNGTFIAFATQPGNITRDGAGDHSPFTAALIENMETPGISISDMMIKVRNSVEVATLETQTPWDQSSLRNQFYFLPQNEESAALTDEDKELLASLNPALRKKFEARFGIRIEAGEETEDGRTAARVTKVKPTLLIQQGQVSAIEIVVEEENAVKGRFKISQGEGDNIELASLQVDKNPVASRQQPENDNTAEIFENSGNRNSATIPVPRPVFGVTKKGKPQLLASISQTEIAPKTPTRIGAEPTPKAATEAQVATTVNDNEKLSSKIITEKNVAVKSDTGVAKAVSTASQATVIVGEPGQLSGAVDAQNSDILSPRATGAEKSQQALTATTINKSKTSQRVASISPSSNSSAATPVIVTRNVAIAVDNAGKVAKQATRAEVKSSTTAPRRLVGKEVLPDGGKEKPESKVEVASLSDGDSGPDSSPDRVTTAVVPSITPPSHAIEVQTELRRLGCYRSQVDGIWGSNSARALLRYYGHKKIAPDELEPTGALLASLQSEEVVVCKRTITTKKKRKIGRGKASKKVATSKSKKRKKARTRKAKRKIVKRAARKKALKKGLSSGVFR